MIAISFRRSLVRLLVVASIGCALLVASSAQAQTSKALGPLNVTFYNSGQSDETGASIGDWNSSQMDAVAAGISYWSSRILNAPARPIQVHIFWANLGQSLGTSSIPVTGDGVTSKTFVESAYRDGSVTASPNTYDVRLVFNPYLPQTFDVAAPAYNYTDFRSVVSHQMGQIFGFKTSYNSSGGTFSSLGLTNWDKLLTDGSGHQPLAGGSGTPGTFNATANPVYFTGTNAVAIYGGNVPVYAPLVYQNELSLQNLNYSTFSGLTMAPFLQTGVVRRQPSALEWGIMSDLGWSLSTTANWTNGAAAATWSNSGDWSPANVPNQNTSITFNNTGLTTGGVVALGGSQSVHALTFNTSTSFTLGSGSNSLTIAGGNIARTTASSGTQTIASPITLGADALWNIEGSGRLALASSLNSSGSLYKFGAGTVSMAGPVNLVGTMTVDAGDVYLSAGGSITADKVTGNGTVDFDGGSIVQTGTNSLLSLGGVRVGKQAVGSYTLSPSMSMTAASLVTIGRDSGGVGTFLNSSGTLRSNGNLFVGAFTGSRGTLTQQTNAAPGSPLPATLIAGGTYIGGEIYADGGGTGTIIVQSGSFTTAGLYIGPPGVNAAPTATFTQTGGSVTVTSELKMGGTMQSIYNLNGGTLFTPNLNAWTPLLATMNLGGGTLHATCSFGTSVPILVSAPSTIDTGGNCVSIGGILAGTGNLQKAGSGTLTLCSSSNYSGDLSVAAGTLILSNSAALAKAAIDLTGGSLSFDGLHAANVGSLSGSGDLSLSSSFSLIVGGNNLTTTFGGAISGSGATLTKIGSGMFSLTGSDSYDGGTLVLAGTLDFLTSQSKPSGGALTVAPGATVILGYTPPPTIINGAPFIDPGLAYENPPGEFSLSDPPPVGLPIADVVPSDIVAVPEPGTFGLLVAAFGVGAIVLIRGRFSSLSSQVPWASSIFTSCRRSIRS